MKQINMMQNRKQIFTDQRLDSCWFCSRFCCWFCSEGPAPPDPLSRWNGFNSLSLHSACSGVKEPVTACKTWFTSSPGLCLDLDLLLDPGFWSGLLVLLHSSGLKHSLAVDHVLLRAAEAAGQKVFSCLLHVAAVTQTTSPAPWHTLTFYSVWCLKSVFCNALWSRRILVVQWV